MPESTSTRAASNAQRRRQETRAVHRSRTIELIRRLAGVAAFALATATSGNAFSEMVVTEADRRHWSFLPLQRPAPPRVNDARSIRTPVDRFVMAKLESGGLAPTPPAEGGRVARRIYFDLIGIPPSPDEVAAFARRFEEDSGAATAELVDRLLDSPHYGERWARHWLDVARYADSDGQESDADRPTAYHYRDFVIASMNEDRAFDTFLRWQLAGDELEPDNPRALAATGFIAAGTHAALPENLMEEERLRNRFNELDDMIATTGSAMLGLTLACARCHDHKYDPVPRRDYYRMLSAFNGGERAEVPLATLSEVGVYRRAESEWKEGLQAAEKALEERIQQARQAHGAAARLAKIDALKASDEEKSILKGESKQAGSLAKKFSKELKVSSDDLKPFLTDADRADWKARERAVQEWNGRQPKPLPTAFAFADFSHEPRETHLLARGDFRAKGEPVELGFLTVLTREKSPADYWAAAREDRRRTDTTQQRRALAVWLTDLEHGAGALAARVIVNRVWQHHFGQGLVRTVNDFGTRCDPPTHPELLEWLTSEFVRGGWKLKPLHRMIVTSAVYLQDTDFDAHRSELDPDNRLLWRRRPQRLEAEILRDSILAVSGQLNVEIYGPAFKAPIVPEAIQARNMKNPYPKDLRESAATRRRSIYMFHKRVVQHPLMQAFDGPDAQASCGRRENTTVAPQALALLNDAFVRGRATDFAERLGRDAGRETESRVRLAWRLALGREPSERELAVAAGFIEEQFRRRSLREPGGDRLELERLALADFCQALFALNEFIYVD